jgi:hypothetical protein
VSLVAVVVVSDEPEQPIVKAARGKSNRFMWLSKHREY